MQKDAAEVKLSCRLEEIAGDHSTKGGSSETEAKEFAVIPKGPWAVFTVTTVTPVPKRPKARRSAGASPLSGAKGIRSSLIATSGAMWRLICPAVPGRCASALLRGFLPPRLGRGTAAKARRWASDERHHRPQLVSMLAV